MKSKFTIKLYCLFSDDIALTHFEKLSGDQQFILNNTDL